MLSDKVKQRYESSINLINATLSDYLCIKNTPYQIVADAMQYSVENGGKRIRPMLVLEFCKACGGDIIDALPFAAALELIHTYSLVHDDLPCMDNDKLRRGKESTWKKYGETYGVLAGDALLTYAFQIASGAGVSDHTIVKCTRLLANYAGIYGMIGGQTLDINNEKAETLDFEELKETERLKTGALIRCACEMGCEIAGASKEQFEAAKVFAENLGLAFQIVDDILDVTGDPTILGKEVGQDLQNGKITYVTLLGIDGAEKLAKEYTEKALEALSIFDDAEYLAEITKYLLNRNK